MSDGVSKELKSIKQEIEDFSASFFSDWAEDIQNDLKKLLKDIYFLKYISQVQDKENHFITSMTSDYIFMLKSFQDNNYRYINLNLRSIIEHCLRFTLEESSKGTDRTSGLLEKMKNDLGVSNKCPVDVGIINHMYQFTCDYIHGNANADMPIIKYYEETLTMGYNKKKHRTLLKQTVKVSKELFLLLLTKHHDLIDYAFHRKKTILKYLTNEDYVSTLRGLAH